MRGDLQNLLLIWPIKANMGERRRFQKSPGLNFMLSQSVRANHISIAKPNLPKEACIGSTHQRWNPFLTSKEVVTYQDKDIMDGKDMEAPSYNGTQS